MQALQRVCRCQIHRYLECLSRQTEKVNGTAFSRLNCGLANTRSAFELSNSDLENLLARDFVRPDVLFRLRPLS